MGKSVVHDICKCSDRQLACAQLKCWDTQPEARFGHETCKTVGESSAVVSSLPSLSGSGFLRASGLCLIALFLTHFHHLSKDQYNKYGSGGHILAICK